MSASTCLQKGNSHRLVHSLHFQPQQCQGGVIKCLKWRVTRICETEDLKAEEDHLRTTYLRNAYREGFITGEMKPRTNQEAQQTVTEASNPRIKTLCILPYMHAKAGKIADICRKAGVQPVFRQKTTHSVLCTLSLLIRVKGPQKHLDKGVVYQISCAQCNEVYISETGRP